MEHLNNRVLHIVMCRPARRNALSEEMLAALTAAFDRANGDRGVGAIVLSAQGPAFCAGHDLKELTSRRQDPDHGRAYFNDIMKRCATLMQAIVACQKPVIAAVEGVATAAGCQLVATCDLAVASRTARFATPGVNIGLFCSTPMVALSRNVSRKHAMEMLLLGEAIDGERAAELGLVNRAVEPGQALAEAGRLASVIAAKSATSVRIGKAAFYAQIEAPLADAYAETSEIMVRSMLADDAVEGICAFLEKRPPNWTP